MSFAHMSVGGTLGGDTSYEFRRNNDLISLTTLTKGQSQIRLVAQSETVPVAPLVLDTLIEQTADSLQPFLKGLPKGLPHNTLESLIYDLRKACRKRLDEEG